MDVEFARSLLGTALSRGGDFAEVFAEARLSFGLRLESSRVESAGTGADQGISLRLARGDTTVFGYAEAEDESSVLSLAERLSRGLAEQACAQTALPLVLPLAQREASGGAGGPSILGELALSSGGLEKSRAHGAADVLRNVDEKARSLSPHVVQVLADLSGVEQRVAVVNSLGVEAGDERRRAFLAVTVIARRGDIVQTGRETLALNGSLELPTAEAASAAAAEAAHKALVMLDAQPAPTGRMPVVLANGFGGVLFHEACGHGLEADYILKGASVWQNKLGMRVAPAFLTAYDDGATAGLWGSTCIDDEGTPTRRTAVIEEGVLVGYLTDLLRAGRLSMPLTGNGRRESFRYLPYPRMTNTYFAPGRGTAADLIGDTQRALYAKSLSGGEVNPATGDFVFGVSEGYLIENGGVGQPVRGATLVGNGLEVLSTIEAVAADLDVAPGFCGKEGQLVPVGTGQPTVRVREMTVGGTDVPS